MAKMNKKHSQALMHRILEKEGVVEAGQNKLEMQPAGEGDELAPSKKKPDEIINMATNMQNDFAGQVEEMGRPRPENQNVNIKHAVEAETIYENLLGSNETLSFRLWDMIFQNGGTKTFSSPKDYFTDQYIRFRAKKKLGHKEAGFMLSAWPYMMDILNQGGGGRQDGSSIRMAQPEEGAELPEPVANPIPGSDRGSL